MKTKLILGSFLALAGIVNAQNTFPTPSGNVGIGTTSPAEMLDIEVPGASGGMQIKNNSTNSAYLSVRTTGTGNGYFMLGATGSSQTEGNGRFVIHDANAHVTRFLIDPSGNIGIGTNSPGAKVEVSSSVNAGTGNWGIRSTIVQTNTPLSYVPVVAVEGNASTNTVRTGELHGVNGIATNGYYNVGGFFQGNGSNGCYGDASYGVKAIASGGQHNYGIWAESNSSPSGCGVGYAGYFVGDVLRTGGDNFTSDRKLKKDIVLLTNSLEKIMKLKPSSYLFKNDEFKTMNLPEGKQMGLIAQELEEVFPELVKTVPANYTIAEDGTKIERMPEFKAVRYINLIPLLIGGIQEQQKTIETQQKQLDEQKALIDQLSQKASNTTGINSINPVETGFQMSQNEPNPFTHETVVKYTMPQTISNAFMAVYDLTGKQITTFPITEKGSSSLTITSEKLAAGIYIYSIVADGKVVDSKRMIVAEK